MNFAQTAKQTATHKLTENGAHAYSTTNNPVLDLFAEIGSLRPRSEGDILLKFSEAFACDRTLATKMFFYAGNIRGGLGERRTFRIILKYLANTYPSVVLDNIHLIPHFNRWDSMFTLVGTACENEMWNVIGEQLTTDLQGVKASRTSAKPVGISLLAKWMPTETAHSKETQKLARLAMKRIGLTPRLYRKMLSTLRNHLKIVEGLMSAQAWDKVEYPAVPSYAMKNYRKAFGKHDQERFSAYIESLKKGEKKINASTLYPYDLVHQYWSKWNYSIDEIVEAQWKALPNYIEGENNVLVMADVSGSMSWHGGRPIETSIGLAIYFAQHATSDYHNLYMTFTDRPHFISLDGCNTLASAVKKVQSTDVGYSTNLEAAFDYILKHALQHNVSPADMPKALIVVSDMEIDPYFRGRGLDFVQYQKTKFAQYGYELPKLVMWNVEARNDTFLSQSDDVLLVSGQSASMFKQLCGDLNGVTAWDLMLKTLNDPMYDCIKV